MKRRIKMVVVLVVSFIAICVSIGCICAAASNKLKSDEEKARDDDEQMEAIENMKKEGKFKK